jgi:hypothetical protein
LDADKLAAVWEHHVKPLLGEHFAAQPSRIAGYEMGGLMNGRRLKQPIGARGGVNPRCPDGGDQPRRSPT